MLKQLRIQNYAIIDDLVIDFKDGLNVLTGETGAGKSIIVGALGLVLGERATDEVVRRDKDVCVVEAVFSVRPSMLRQLAGIDPHLNETLEVKRELPRRGRSRCWIGDRQVSLNHLKAIGNFLVDFHGQHEHQRLVHVDSHVDFLDGFARLGGLRQKVRHLRRDLIDLRRKIKETKESLRCITEQEHIIQYDIDEIEQMNLAPDEDETIEREIQLLSHGEKIIEAGAQILDCLYEGDESAISKIAQAMVLMDEIVSLSGEMDGLRGSLDEAHVIVKEVAESLRDKIASIDLDPSRLESMRERLVAIERLKRKYGKSLRDLLEHLVALKNQLSSREELEQQIARLQARVVELEEALAEVCLDLRRRRQAAAKRFETRVEDELKALGIVGAGFRVVFDEIDEGEVVGLGENQILRVSDSGADYVEFFVRTNVGEELLPLRRIASGGEISRVMLALKKLLAASDEVETLIFDEIDAGIGGSLADVVGARLAELGKSHQVICITHLPQIAAAATTHFAVGKKVVRRRTTADVTLLDERGRVAELARMIGGRKPPETARAHAATLLRRMAVR